MDWNQLPERFPALRNMTYLNTASTGLMPVEVLNLMQLHHGAYLEGGSRAFPQLMEKIQEVRALAAALINASPYEVAFVPSVAIGMQHLARMFRHLKTVAALSDDFPTVRSAWELNGFAMVNFQADSNGYIPFEAIEAAEADVLVLSHVQWHTGFRADIDRLAAMCRSRGQLFILDATQSLGYYPIDVKSLPVDVLLVSCYKWLMGGFGNAILYIRREWLDRHPVKINWQIWEEDGKVLPSARRFEIGHERVHDIVRSGIGMQLILEQGQEVLAKRTQVLVEYLLLRLKEDGIPVYSDYGPLHRSAIHIVPGSEETLQFLQHEDVEVSLRGRGIRISPYFYNTFADVDRVVDLLVKASK